VDIYGWRILVADDNATNRLILRQFLTMRGASVVEAQDGRETLAAMETAREQRLPFRLLLLDGRMPGIPPLPTTIACLAYSIWPTYMS
jgi:CheY-like chemotaxis protein